MAQADDETTIRSALAAMTAEQPPAPPGRYSAVARRVAANRRRRLASVALAVAILVATAMAIPLGWLRTGPPPPPAAPRYHVTVVRPPKGSPRSLVATGRINGLPWRAEVSRKSDGEVCETTVVAGGSETGCSSGPPATMNPSGYPVGNLETAQVNMATVRADVTDVQIAYTNGQVLNATPVSVFGRRYARYIAFAAPYDAAVTRITAFSAHGQIAYAVPFTASTDAGIVLVRWLHPGQQARPRPVRYLAGTGVRDGKRWRDELYVGPWGTCFVHPVSPDLTVAFDCFPSLGWLQGKPRVATLIGFAHQLSLEYVYGQAEPDVRYLIVTTAHGHTSRVPANRAGSRRFFVFVSQDADPAVRWAAYDAGGRVLASGPVRFAG
jgi:hypothetical protein